MKPQFIKITYGLVLLLLATRLFLNFNYPVKQSNLTRSKLVIAEIIRGRLTAVYQQLLPGAEAGLVAGVILGEKNLLGARANGQLRATGLTHLIVASGTNLVFLVGIVLIIAKKLSRRVRVVVLGLVVIFYSFLTGFDPPIMRAAVMVCCSNFAGLAGRPYWPYWVVILTAAVLIFIDPNLTISISFQLSFTATVGQIFFGRLANRLPILNHFWMEIILTTVFAQIFTLPIVLSNFGIYSLTSILANALVVWTIPWITSISLVAGIATIINLTIGRIIILPVHALTFYFWQVVGFLSSNNGLVIKAKIIDPTVWIIYCLILLFCILWTEKLSRLKLINLLTK